MHGKLIRIVGAAVFLGCPAAADQLSDFVKTPVTVPEGNGAPVVTDGIFSPGEWDDSLQIPLPGNKELRLKQYRGVVFIAVRGVGPSELSLAVPGGPIKRLHVSAQLFEVVLPATGPLPEPRFGFTQDWYANELRRDEKESERLQKEGKSPMEIIKSSSYPSDGIEFAIRRSKLPGDRWLTRLWATAFIDDKPGLIIYPPAAAEKTTEGWLELRFK
jgi:hypothetical protein